MEYEAFKETLMDFLREKTGGEKSISLHRVEKNNGIELDALVVRGKRDKIAPMIYLKTLLRRFSGRAFYGRNCSADFTVVSN